jgi:hypothetical protein
MTPAEELRAAAALLRERAAKTSGGTWTAEYLDQHNCWWVDHRTETSDSTTYGTVADLESIDMAGNAAWIALMSPAVAEPLAALLESEADCQESIADVSDGVPRLLDSLAGEPTEATLTVTIDTGVAALAFARAITKENGQ